MACSRCLAPWHSSSLLLGPSEQLRCSEDRRRRSYTSALFGTSPSNLLVSRLGEVAPHKTHRQLVIRAAKKKGAPVNKAAAAKKEKEAAEAAAVAAKNATPYTDPDVFIHSLLLIDSYQRATGKPLFTNLDLPDSGRALFKAPFVCVSHDGGEDPVFDYGNKAALELFEMSWDEFTKLPSRKSAAPDAPEQEGRNKLLAEALEKGAVTIQDAQRYTSTGKAFTIKQGTLWTVTDLEGERLGQAAVFSEIELSDGASSSGEQVGAAEQTTAEQTGSQPTAEQQAVRS